MGLTFQKLHCNQSVYIDSISIKNNKTCKLWQMYMKYYSPCDFFFRNRLRLLRVKYTYQKAGQNLLEFPLKTYLILMSKNKKRRSGESLGEGGGIWITFIKILIVKYPNAHPVTDHWLSIGEKEGPLFPNETRKWSAAEGHKDGKQKGGRVGAVKTYQSKDNTQTPPSRPPPLLAPAPPPFLCLQLQISLSCTSSVVVISTEWAV
jgi:hypothetical protein